jgi:hypothetical protein
MNGRPMSEMAILQQLSQRPAHSLKHQIDRCRYKWQFEDKTCPDEDNPEENRQSLRGGRVGPKAEHRKPNERDRQRGQEED